VELLLITPLLAVLFFGVMALTLANRLKADLVACARAGADYASFDLARSGNLAAIVAAGEAVAAEIDTPVTVTAESYCGCLDTATETLTVVSCSTGSCPVTDTRPQRFVRVRASSTYQFPWVLPGLPASWNLEATADARMF
jgi:Flp pilus assembly protein TadG